jgi:hypothetical protein
MKKAHFLIAILFLNGLFMSLAGQQVRYINVGSDSNSLGNYDRSGCLSCSESTYIIDGDECLGDVVLEFNDVDNFNRVKTVSLIMNCADVEWAETGTGFKVFMDNQQIGSISSVYRDSGFSLNLDASKLRGKSYVKLILKPVGIDGVYIMSKKSGFGALLKLEY